MAGATLGPLGPFGQVLGTGIGIGAANALVPPAQDLANTAWRRFPDRPLDPLTLASGVAQGQVDRGWATDEALNMGVTKERFDHLVDIANIGPGMAQAFNLWRRGEIGGEAGFRRALRRLGLEDEWINGLWNVREDILDPAQLAVMIQRTVIPNNGILPNQPSTAGSNVPPMPVVDINAVTEAAGSGISADRLAAMARIIGLPASPDLAARMHFRKIITEGAYNQAILEGNTRGEWAPFLLEGFRQILTANQYAELQLRGFMTETQRRNGTAKHGMSDTDSDHLFDVLGRSINVHQIVTGEARGGTYKPPPDTLAQQTAGIPPAFLASLQRGNLRPEYYSLAYANRYTYPSFFAIRGLLTGGVLKADEGYQILLEMGWKPTLARKVADFYGVATTATTTGPLTKSAVTQAITEIRSAFLIGQVDEGQARGWLTTLGVSVGEQDGVIGVWNVMREIPQKGLTAAQIVKAFKKLPAQWPRARALDELQLLGLTLGDANTLLDE